MGLSSGVRKTVLIMSILTGVFFVSYIVLRSTTLQCTRPELQKNFDPDQYLGVWYELRRDKSIPYETGECVTAQYSYREDGNLKVDNN